MPENQAQPEPRVALVWQAGPPKGFVCTACQRTLGRSLRAAYHHRARYHKGCRAMVLGLPGAKRSRFKFAGEAQREAHKIKIRKVASMAPMELLAALEGPFVGPAKAGEWHRAVHYPHVPSAETGRAAEVGTVMVTRVRGSGRRILTGAGTWKTKQASDVAMTVVATQMEGLARRFGTGEGGGVALEGPEWDVQLSMGHTGSMASGWGVGLALATAVAALMLRRELRPGVMVTGDIDLRGRVHAVGDVLMQINAGLRGGLTTVLVPHEDFMGIDLSADLVGHDELRAYIVAHVQPVRDLAEALRYALEGGEEEQAAAAEEEGPCRVAWASCPFVVYQRHVLPLTVEAALVPGAGGKMWATGEFLPYQERVEEALTCLEGLRQQPWWPPSFRPLGPLLKDQGLHVHIKRVVHKNRRIWDVVGVTLGLALLSLSLLPDCPKLAEGVAVLGDLRADGAITGKLEGMPETLLPLASRQGWKLVFVPASEVAKLQEACAGKDIEIIGAEWLTDCLPDLLYLSGSPVVVASCEEGPSEVVETCEEGPSEVVEI